MILPYFPKAILNLPQMRIDGVPYLIHYHTLKDLGDDACLDGAPVVVRLWLVSILRHRYDVGEQCGAY